MKKCGRCQVNKEDKEFSPDARNKDGLNGYCKACRCEYETARRAIHKDKINQRNRDLSVQRGAIENRIRKRMYVYGLTRAQAEQVEAQTTCEWCNRPFTDETPIRGAVAKSVHHDHNTGYYVATLCGYCNTIEGWVVQGAESAGMSVKEYLNILIERI